MTRRRRPNGTIDDFFPEDEFEENPVSVLDAVYWITGAIRGEKDKLDLLHDKMHGRKAVLASSAVNMLDRAIEQLEELVERLKRQ